MMKTINLCKSPTPDRALLRHYAESHAQPADNTAQQGAAGTAARNSRPLAIALVTLALLGLATGCATTPGTSTAGPPASSLGDQNTWMSGLNDMNNRQLMNTFRFVQQYNAWKSMGR